MSKFVKKNVKKNEILLNNENLQTNWKKIKFFLIYKNINWLFAVQLIFS